ncbi:hypothetical protein [Allorhodopirellula heiligendammensis]|uniref:Ternary complex associated domain-containing protein n=1 Tax=Allorhodopirellula heiligendammensis TaxID=2714739 RepID=A0A5C6C5S5_9BACT|nr:hypothetical protein [Allorhodopirellula heiligendammensis]TWU19508.1 hypothetical protein Poly21_16810 [Allorhodopirellula heiligendammensis]
MRGLEIDLFDPGSEKSLLDSAFELLSTLVSNDAQGEDLRCKIWPSLHGNSVEVKECSLRVVPLNRLGAAEGKSSASVFVAYFVAEASLWPSHPFIVKLAKPKPGSDQDSCEREFQDAEALKFLIGHSPTGYAAPLRWSPSDSERPYSVLWSPFASADDIWGDVELHGGRLNLRVADIWKLLTSTELATDQVCDALQLAFESLWPLHRKGGKSQVEVRQFSVEYERYLRKIHTSIWAARWRDCWGADNDELSIDFGQEWTNPFNVLKRIQDCKARMYCGGIHGDLHPKNIVLSRGIPRIIDFGWADGDAHIAKDFVLFECNVRFVTLPAATSYQDVVRLAQWISFEDDSPHFESPELQGRVQLVSFIRKHARKAFPTETEWDWEYVIPLFLVAMGLLKHSNDFSSQVSTRQHVLQLAKYISERILPKYESRETNR